MAYDKFGLQINRGTTTANGQGSGTSVIHTYINLNDTIATIETTGYFPDSFVDVNSNPNIPPQTVGENIIVNDYLFIRGSDGARITVVTSLDPVVISASVLMPNTLTVSDPIAATDNNGLTYAGGILQTEFADATHNGIVSTVNQNIAGEKFFAEILTAQNGIDTTTLTASGNITCPTLTANTSINTGALSATVSVDTAALIAGTINVGASATSMAYFANNNFTATWSGPWGVTTYTSLVSAVRINDIVTICVKGIADAASSIISVITGNPGLPPEYIPSTFKNGTVVVTSNGVATLGSFTITNGSGIIIIGSDLIGDSFPVGDTGFSDLTFSYNLTV